MKSFLTKEKSISNKQRTKYCINMKLGASEMLRCSGQILTDILLDKGFPSPPPLGGVYPESQLSLFV